ncbi:MAG: twin-arginine translocase TatA/TatE family subunit [Bacteroidales bacterium]
MGSFLLFFNISGGEIFIIVLVVYLVFGPKKIPELARMLGKGINELRRATNEVRNEISREVNQVKNDIDLKMDDPDEKQNKKAKPPEKPAVSSNNQKAKSGTEDELKLRSDKNRK